MEANYISNENFDRVNYTDTVLAKGEYEDCTFTHCVLAQVDLQRVTFVECTFENCDVSMANINGTAFREVRFENCKLLGLRFEHCNEFLFSVGFNSCQLNLSSFYNLSLKGTRFENCNLSEVDFAGTDLTGAIFNHCDLQNALFDNTILEKADLRTSFGFTIDPEGNRVKKAKFSLDALPGLLTKYDIIIG
ncbi:MAG: pentapeptide repeat-containing protein [Cytophagales bacterium]|nr:pentapeptide repeat-containing protein [Cytophagales bacterium]